MKRFSDRYEEEVEIEEIDNFIADIFEVYKKHGMSIAHEDCHGGFLIQKDCEFNRGWLMQASDDMQAPIPAFPPKTTKNYP